VGEYVRAYRKNGLEGLVRRASPGAPHKLTPEQEKELIQTVVHSLPVDVGFTARHNWTLALIVSFVEQKWQKKYTLRGMSRLLSSLGLSYSKATYTLAQGDVVKQAAFLEETFPALKKD
jgi:putative transposase